MNKENFEFKPETLKNGLSTCKIPIFETPKSEEIFIYLNFDEESKAINCDYINKEVIIQNFQIENFPVEKCKKCQCELTINNLYFPGNDSSIEFFCNNCSNDKESNILSLIEKNLYTNNQLINKLMSFLNNNNDLTISLYKNTMNNLISFTNDIIIIYELFKSKSVFKIPVKFMENYIENLNFYLEIVDKINLKNLYLFFKNLCIVSSIKKNKNFFNNFLDKLLNIIHNYNISEIQLFMFNKIFNKESRVHFILIENTINQNINSFVKGILTINQDLSSLIQTYNDKRFEWMKEKIKINEYKRNIINFLSNYNYSYNYISSKKVLERKFINEIIYILFKYNHKKFKQININEYIYTSIEKELHNIDHYLSHSWNNSAISLRKKIKEQINYFKKQSDNIKYNYSKNVSIETSIKNKEIFLTNEEKEILKNYLSSTTEDSYSSIYASNEPNPEGISYKKIQVILEFLFFIRDKTISIIHLLNETSTLFFNFLNQYSSGKKIEENDKNEINEIIDSQNNNDEDDLNVDELKKEFDCKFSKDYKTHNENVFKNLKIEGVIDCHSALNYIFSNINNNDYSKEINYLYNNIVLPERNNMKESIKELELKSKYSLILDKIDTIYNKLKYKFKNDPLYDLFMAYIDPANKIKNKEWEVMPEIIKFYIAHVDNFDEFINMFNLKTKAKEYIKLIEMENMNIEKLKLVKEKYILIQKEIKNYLNPNQEKYQLYYDEWKKKNEKIVVENYELKDIINDLKRLIPKEATIKITNREKRNFYLILYLFQSGYFLKDYI